MDSSPEKRRFARESCQNQVRFRVAGGAFFEGGAVDSFAATLVDISENGVGLLTDIPLRPGQHVHFLEVPAGADMGSDGVVVWSIESREGFRVGVMFSGKA